MNDRARFFFFCGWGMVVFSCLILLFPAAASQQEDRALSIDEAKQAAIIDSVTVALNRVYIFSNVALEMEKLVRQNFTSGKYKGCATLPDFNQMLTEDLRSVSHDKHLRVGIYREPGEPAPASLDDARQRRLERLRAENYGFKRLEILPGNIGYIDLRMFADAANAGPTAVAAMNYFAHADAIIFDLRQNGGGSPSMIQLLSSYFFPEPVHLNSFYIRQGDSTQQFWTQAHVQGLKMANTPLFVLTSGTTFSAAEEFTYNMKNLKRATIVGETTGGGAHPVDIKVFESLNVQMSLPYGRAINPISGTNWEGTGVAPDVKTTADQALLFARIEALKSLRDKTADESRKIKLDWLLAGLECEKNPLPLAANALKEYAGQFGPRRIYLENGRLYYQRQGRPAFIMIPMSRDLFMVESLDYFRLKFNRDAKARIVELQGLYDNGQSDSHVKNK